MTFYLLLVRISKQISLKSQLCTRVDISKSIHTIWVSLSKLMSSQLSDHEGTLYVSLVMLLSMIGPNKQA